MKAIAPEVEGRIVGGPAVFAADQPEYQPLPAWTTDAGVITRWRLSWRERIRVLLGGDLWLSVLTFGRPLQPLLPSTERDEVVDELNLWAGVLSGDSVTDKSRPSTEDPQRSPRDADDAQPA